MLASFLLGLWLVRLLLGFGADTAAVVLFLGAGIGLGALVQQLFVLSLTPVLALAYHSQDANKFRSAYCSAAAICALAGPLIVVAFVILAAAVASLDMPTGLLTGARWYIASKGVEAAVAVLVAPQITMLLVQHRIIAYNACFLSERVSEVTAIGAVALLSLTEPGKNIATFGCISTALRCIVLLFAAVAARRNGATTRFQISVVSRAEIGKLMCSLGANSLVALATTFYVRFDNLVVNLSGGLLANLVFSIATQFAAYVRILTHGQAIGLESVSARTLAGNRNDPASLKGIVRSSSRHQAILILPAICLLATLADPIIRLWIGTQLSSPAQTIPVVVATLRLMLLGMTARALTEGWQRILNGAGYVKVFLRPILVGAIVNAVVLASVVWALPTDFVVYVVASLFALLHVLVHLLWIPRILRDIIQVDVREIWLPILRPLAVTIGCSPVLFLVHYVNECNVVMLSLIAALYLVIYGLASFLVSLTLGERIRIIQSVTIWRSHPATVMEHRSSR